MKSPSRARLLRIRSQTRHPSLVAVIEPILYTVRWFPPRVEGHASVHPRGPSAAAWRSDGWPSTAVKRRLGSSALDFPKHGVIMAMLIHLATVITTATVAGDHGKRGNPRQVRRLRTGKVRRISPCRALRKSRLARRAPSKRPWSRPRRPTKGNQVRRRGQVSPRRSQRPARASFRAGRVTGSARRESEGSAPRSRRGAQHFSARC